MHWIGNTRDYNAFVRQVRASLLNAPRVQRSTTKDIAVTGYVYKDSGNTDRSESDIGFAIAEKAAPLGLYRATCLVAGGAASWGAGQSLVVTFNSAARTLALDDNSSWVTKGFVAGDLVRIENAAVAAHNNLARILSFSNGGGTNSVMTLSADDTFISANTAADTITAYPIGGGAIFEIEYDSNDDATVDAHVGWLASNVESYTEDFDLWVALNVGNSNWVVGDYWQFTLEHGPFTLNEDRVVNIENVVISGTNVLTLSAIDQAHDVTWTTLGFTDEERIDILVSSGANTGRYRISALTASALTLQTLAGGAPGLTNGTVTIQAVPKYEVDVDFDTADATFSSAPTIVLNGGGNWVDLGFVANGYIQVEDATDTGNRGYWKILSIGTESVTNDTLVLEAGALATINAIDLITATPRNGSLQAWSEYRFRLAASGTTTSSTDDAMSSSGVANGRLLRPDTDGNYVTEWIGIGPGIDPTNNAQTVYVGLQTQFSGSTLQNVEHRNFDVLSDSAFGLMLSGKPDVRVYTFHSVAAVMETFLEFDGDHITGFNDVGSATTTWFYQGYIAVRGTQNQLPRPMFLGGTGFAAADTRDSLNSGDTSFFFNGVSQSTVNGTGTQTPQYATGWFRWIDGQWFAAYHSQVGPNQVAIASPPVRLAIWPWNYGGIVTANADFFGGVNDASILPSRLGRTPSSFDATDRHYLLTPATIWMETPDKNLIGDLKGVHFIPGVGGLATNDRQLLGSRAFYIGQNHKNTTSKDFAALELT